MLREFVDPEGCKFEINLVGTELHQFKGSKGEMLTRIISPPRGKKGYTHAQVTIADYEEVKRLRAIDTAAEGKTPPEIKHLDPLAEYGPLIHDPYIDPPASLMSSEAATAIGEACREIKAEREPMTLVGTETGRWSSDPEAPASWRTWALAPFEPSPEQEAFERKARAVNVEHWVTFPKLVAVGCCQRDHHVRKAIEAGWLGAEGEGWRRDGRLFKVEMYRAVRFFQSDEGERFLKTCGAMPPRGPRKAKVKAEAPSPKPEDDRLLTFEDMKHLGNSLLREKDDPRKPARRRYPSNAFYKDIVWGALAAEGATISTGKVSAQAVKEWFGWKYNFQRAFDNAAQQGK